MHARLNDDRDVALDALLGAGARLAPSSAERPGCTLIGGVGLPWLRDLDFGTNWLAQAAERSWPPEVVLEDLSYAAHRVMHRLEELQPARAILVACTPRGAEPAGTIRRYSLYDTPPPSPDEVQDRIAEAVGGIIDLDHTLVVCRHWGALPADTVVIEVEPEDREFGWGFSPPVQAAVSRVIDMARAEATR